jgi:hypothetical protein
LIEEELSIPRLTVWAGISKEYVSIEGTVNASSFLELQRAVD